MASPPANKATNKRAKKPNNRPHAAGNSISCSSNRPTFSFPAILTSSKGHNRYRNPETFQMTPALYRVRKPFFWKNFASFFAVTAIPLGVYMYTWGVLSQDEFSDIPIPPISDEELAKLKKEYESK